MCCSHSSEISRPRGETEPLSISGGQSVSTVSDLFCLPTTPTDAYDMSVPYDRPLVRGGTNLGESVLKTVTLVPLRALGLFLGLLSKDSWRVATVLDLPLVLVTTASKLSIHKSHYVQDGKCDTFGGNLNGLGNA